MNVIVRASIAFKRQAKPLLKKYLSLTEELRQLEVELTENPFLGKEIMPNVFKIRLAIKSKGKGKSGGGRIISFHQENTNMLGIVDQQYETDLTITLIAIYDKSVTDNITDKEIIQLIKLLEEE